MVEFAPIGGYIPHMTKAEALAVLEAAVDTSKHEKVRTKEVRLALKALLPHSSTREWLDWFWEVAGNEEPIGRFQSVNSALAGIKRRLR